MSRHSVHLFIQDQSDLDMVADVASTMGLVVTKALGGKVELITAVQTWAVMPQIIVVDMRDEECPVDALKEIAEASPESDVEVIIIGSNNDVKVARRLSSMGVADYLVLPIEKEDVKSALTTSMGGSENVSVRVDPNRLVVCTSSEGGTGASTLAAAAAYEYASQGYRTLLVDFDFNSGDQYITHGGDKSEGFNRAMHELGRVDSVYLSRIVMRCNASPNLFILSEPGSLDDDPAIPDVSSFISLLTASFEMVVIDIPHHAKWAKSILPMASRVYHSSKPTVSSVYNTKTFFDKMKTGLVTDALVVVLNDLTGAKGEGLSKDDFLKRVECPLMIIPHDPISHCRQSLSDYIGFKSGKAKKAYGSILETLPQPPRRQKNTSQENKKKSFAGKFLNWLNT